MLAIIYWNVRKGKGQDVSSAILQLAIAIAADATLSGGGAEVLMCFSEPKNVDFASILAAINAAGTGKSWWLEYSALGRYVFLSTIARLEVKFDPEVKGSAPCTVTRVIGAVAINYEFWFVHFPAPIHVWQPLTMQHDAARVFRRSVEKRETRMNHNRSLVIGDFNMAPFSEAMVAPIGLNATSCTNVAASVNKKINKTKKIQYFFNPMWPLLGSWSPSRQPGSFFRTDKTIAQQWHMIDQVLLRPSLMTAVESGTPMVLTKAGSIPLTKPNGGIAKISDHLPVLVALKI